MTKKSDLPSIDLKSEREKTVKVEAIDSNITTSQIQTTFPYRKYGRIDDETLKYLSLRPSRIKECIDAITQEVAKKRAILIPIDESKPKSVYQAIESFASQFFSQINRKKDGINQFIARIVRDLLTFDRAIIEKVRNIEGKVVELYVRDPSTFIIKKNENGIIEKFIQKVEQYEIEFDPNDIIYIVLHPCSFDDYGLPIIEGILLEIAEFLIINKVVGTEIFDKGFNDILLVFEEISESAYQRIKELFQSDKYRGKIKVIRNVSPDSVKAINIDRKLIAEDQLDTLLTRIDNIIYKHFLVPSSREVSVNSTSVYFNPSESKYVEYIRILLENVFTYEIFQKEFGLPVKFQLIQATRIDSREFFDYSRGIAQLVNTGVLSHNEARALIGLPPVSGGNKRFGKLGNEYIVYNEDNNMPERLPEFMDIKDI